MKLKAVRTAVFALLAVAAGCMIAIHTPGGGSNVIYAQSVPVVVHAKWDPNVAADNVTGYKLVLDGGTAINVPATIDPSCSCIITPVSIPTYGSHTVVVTATNLLISTDPTSGQDGSPTSIQFTIAASAKVNNGKVTK